MSIAPPPRTDTAALAEGAPPSGLSRRRKAALVVQLLLSEGKKLPVSQLPEEAQLDLTRELGAIRIVDRITLRQVAEEFLNDLEQVGLALPGGVDRAVEALGADLSPAAAARARSEAAAQRSLDPWAQILALPAAELVPIMEREATEIAAVTLSKLSVARAAEVLALLPGERARRVTYAVSLTSDIAPQAVARIGAALAEEYGNPPETAFASPPVQRVGAILNSSPPSTRDSVLEGLGADDPDFAARVRRAIFTFPDIPSRVAKGDVPKVLRGLDGAVLVTALAYAASLGGEDGQAADFILANMSQRMADSLREEIGERGRIRKTDGEQAQGAVVAAIRERADAGEIALIRPETEEEEE